MRYVASYLLAALGGNASPSAKDIKKILDSVGIEADDDRLNKVAARRPGTPHTGLSSRPVLFRKVWLGGPVPLGVLVQPQGSKSRSGAKPRPAWFSRRTVQASCH